MFVPHNVCTSPSTVSTFSNIVTIPSTFYSPVVVPWTQVSFLPSTKVIVVSSSPSLVVV